MPKDFFSPLGADGRKKVMLAGANGFVAAKLGQVLVKAGYEVIALVRSPETWQDRLAFPATVVGWKGKDSDVPKLQSLIEDCGAVINLAGANIGGGRWTAAYKKLIVSSRVEATNALTRAMRQAARKPAVYIQMSGSGYYGDAGETICREGSPVGLTFLADTCAKWEEASNDIPAETRRVILRAGAILGLSGGALQKMASIYTTGMAGCMGDGKQYFSWIHLDDMVGILYAALHETDYRGPINAASPEPVTYQDLHTTLAKSMRVSTGPAVPKAAVRALFGEQADLFLQSQRLTSSLVQSLGYKFLYPELELCLESQFSDQVAAGVSWLIEKIWLPVPVSQVWDFFSVESNLERMTPSTLNFKVRKKSSEQLAAGTTIDYSLRVHGVPVFWRTLIETWEPQSRFVDTQLKGPYSIWHHTHHFFELGNGTLMVDEVQYKLPLGRLGRLAGGWLVDRDVAQIFEFRQKFASSHFAQLAKNTVKTTES